MARAYGQPSSAELAAEERKERLRRARQSLEDAMTPDVEETVPQEAKAAAERLRHALRDGGLEAAAAVVGAAPSRVVEEAPPEEVAPQATVPRGRVRERGGQPRDRAAIARELMGAIWKQWRTTAEKGGFEKAFRELALNIGQDGMSFVDAGLFADVNDLLQCVQRCVIKTGDGKGEEEESGWRGKVGQLQAELRGEE